MATRWLGLLKSFGYDCCRYKCRERDGGIGDVKTIAHLQDRVAAGSQFYILS